MKRFLVPLFFVLHCGDASAYDKSLIGGREVGDGEYGEVVRITNGRASCSATLIGRKVLLTAAHCTSEGGSVRFEYKREVFNAVCALAPDYRQQVGDQDMALCKLDKEYPGALASVSDKGPTLGEEVILIGYGCINPGGGGGNDGILRVGAAPVTRESDEQYYSFHTKGSSALCFGDSGGPSFSMSTPDTHNYVIGVNSRGNIRDLSLLTAVYHPKSREFMTSWAQSGSETLLICGLNTQCDSEEPPPEKCQPEFERFEKRAKQLERAQKRFERAQKKYEQCMQK